MAGSVNLKRVAEVAGVSTTTAHDALSGRGRVNPKTRDSVRKIATKLGYRPNSVARALRLRKSGLIGVVISNLFSHLFERMLPRIERIAFEKGYHVFYACSYSKDNREREVIELLRGSGMEGLLLFPSAPRDNLDFYTSASKELPVVMIEPPSDLRGFDAVGTDNVAGGCAAASALLESGRRNLAFVTHGEVLSEDWWLRDRLHGCAKAVTDAGVPFVVLAPSGARPAVLDRYSAQPLHEYFAKGSSLDGIVAANDDIAYKVIRELRANGRQLPDDVAVIGCDDLASDTSFSPPLSSLRQPMERIGEAAVTLLLRRLGGEKSPPERSLFPPELIERESSAIRTLRSAQPQPNYA